MADPSPQSVRVPSESDLRTLFDHADDMIVSVSPDGRLNYCNAAWEKSLGYDREEMIGRVIFEFVSADDRDTCEILFRRILAGEDLRAIETSLCAKNGGKVHVEGRCRLSTNGDGEVVAVHGIWRDVTIAKREREILESIATGEPATDTLRTLTEFIESVAPELIASALLLDRDGKTLHHGAAPSLPQAYIDAVEGLVIGESVGSCGTAAYRGEPVFVDDIATDPLWADYRDLAKKFGLAACWSTPVKDTAGNVLGTFAIYSRISGECTPQHKRLINFATHLAGLAICSERALSALKESELKFSTIFRCSPDPIALTRVPSGEIVDVNESAARLSGYLRDELIGATSLGLGLLVDPNARDDFRRQQNDNRNVRDLCMDIRRRDGTIRRISVNMDLIELEEELYSLGTIRDVTEREMMVERLRQSEDRLAHAEKIAHLGNWSYEVATGEIEWSEELYRIFGRDPNETLNYDTLLSWVYEDDRERHDQFMARLLNATPEVEIGQLEYRLVRPGGELRWVEVVVEIDFDTAAAPVQFFGTVLDITDRKAAEEAARQAAVAADRLASLSPREREVFEGVVQNLANKMIAHQMSISEKTVEKHRSNVMKKLRAQGVPDLVRLSIAAGMDG